MMSFIKFLAVLLLLTYFQVGHCQLSSNQTTAEHEYRLLLLTPYPRIYDKIEFGLAISDTLKKEIDLFFNANTKKGLNPFNRNDINLELSVYKADSLVRKSFGFYYEEMEVDSIRNEWVNIGTELPFRFRFSCEQNTEYKLKLKVIIRDQLLFSDSTWVRVHENDHQGFLERGRYNKHFRFSRSKKSFVGVGQNIPWLQWVKWDEPHLRAGPKQFEQYMTSLNAFNASDGNFTRLVFAPWSFQLEFEALGNYHNAMGQAFALDRALNFMETNEIYTIICALLHTPLVELREGSDGEKMSWKNYCYNVAANKQSVLAKEEISDVNHPIDFYRSEEAKYHQKNYFRYLISRWGYSSAIAAWQLVSEQDETASYRDEKLEEKIVDHTENRKIIAEWNHEMLAYIQNDLFDFHLLGTSLIGGMGESKNLWQPGLYEDSLVDFHGFHNYYYNFPGMQHSRNGNLLIRYETISSLNSGFQFGKENVKTLQDNLFIYDESGYILTENAEYRPGVQNDPTSSFNRCIDFQFKQDLWFYLTSGAAVAGLDWWNEHDPIRHAAWAYYFPVMQKFIADIDFEKVNYSKIRRGKESYPIIAQRWPEKDKDIKRSNGGTYKNDELIESYTLISENGDQGFGWMNNRSVNVFNLIDSFPCLEAMLDGNEPFGKQVLFYAKDADGLGSPIAIQDEESFIKVRFLSPFTKMKILFYSTTTGEVIQEKMDRVSAFGVLKINCPELVYGKNPDVSYKFWNAKKEWQ